MQIKYFVRENVNCRNVASRHVIRNVRRQLTFAINYYFVFDWKFQKWKNPIVY